MNTAPLFSTKDADNLQLFTALKDGVIVGHFVVNHDVYLSATSYLKDHEDEFPSGSWDFVRSSTQEEFDEMIDRFK